MITPIPPRHHSHTEPFAFWENFLTEEDINKLLSLSSWHTKHTALVGGSNENSGSLNLDARRSEVGWWTPCDQTIFIWQKIINSVAEVNRQFFKFDLSGVYEQAQLSWYDGNNQGHYDWHVDDMPNGCITPRKLSMSLMLSDVNEFDGGDLQIKSTTDNPVTLEQKKGRAWFFPSYTLHRVTPVTKGVRRSLVLWIGGPAFK